MKFFDEKHKQAYETFIDLDKTRETDFERKSLLYLLALDENTRRNINDIYNFEEHWIKPEGMNKGWQCSGSVAITRLAFNLYNGSAPVEEGYNNSKFNPLDIFAPVDREMFEYLFEAILLRFGQIIC